MHLEMSKFDSLKQFICQSYENLFYSINNLRIFLSMTKCICWEERKYSSDTANQCWLESFLIAHNNNFFYKAVVSFF